MRKHFSAPFWRLSLARWHTNASSFSLFIDALRAAPQVGNLVDVFKAHTLVMEPLDGAILIVAGNHLAERNAAADAIQRLIGVDLDVEIRDVGGFLFAATADFGVAVVTTELVQTLLELWVRCELLLKAPQIQVQLPNAIVNHVVRLNGQAHLLIAPRNALRVQSPHLLHRFLKHGILLRARHDAFMEFFDRPLVRGALFVELPNELELALGASELCD